MDGQSGVAPRASIERARTFVRPEHDDRLSKRIGRRASGILEGHETLGELESRQLERTDDLGKHGRVVLDGLVAGDARACTGRERVHSCEQTRLATPTYISAGCVESNLLPYADATDAKEVVARYSRVVAAQGCAVLRAQLAAVP